MEGIIIHYRRGRRTQYPNQMLIRVAGIESREKAQSLLKKKVTWISPAGKQLVGFISNVHGNSGAVRARFEIGLPGQSIGEKVKVE